MINCVCVHYIEEHFKQNISFNEQNNGEISLDIPVNVSVQYCPNNDKEQNDAKVEFILEIGNEENFESQPYLYKIWLAGIFAWDEGDIETIQGNVTADAVNVLMSFARTYFYDNLRKAGLEPFVFPNIESAIIERANGKLTD